MRTGVASFLLNRLRQRRDRLTTIMGSKWQTKIIALASLEQWLKLCGSIPADLVLLSQHESRPDADRVRDIARFRNRKPRLKYSYFQTGMQVVHCPQTDLYS
jgi:hypothetical protein